MTQRHFMCKDYEDYECLHPAIFTSSQIITFTPYSLVQEHLEWLVLEAQFLIKSNLAIGGNENVFVLHSFPRNVIWSHPVMWNYILLFIP